MNLDRMIAVRNNKTVFRDGDRCLKVFTAGFSKADALHEALNQARIEETGLHVPKILEFTEIDGKWAIIAEYINGQTLEQLLQAYPEKRADYLDLLVRVQLEIQSKTCPSLEQLKDRLTQLIHASELRATARYNLCARAEAMPKHGKVCHCDLIPSNIVLTADGTPYVLDWSQVTQGNGAADAVHTYLLLRLRGEDADDYLARYCAQSGTDCACVEKWIPIVAAALAVKSNAAERALLNSWVKL